MYHGRFNENIFELSENVLALAEASAERVLNNLFQENQQLIQAVLADTSMTTAAKNFTIATAAGRYTMLEGDLKFITQYRQRKEMEAEQRRRFEQEGVFGNRDNLYTPGGYVEPGLPPQSLGGVDFNPMNNAGHPPRSNMWATPPAVFTVEKYMFNYDGCGYEAVVIQDTFGKVQKIVTTLDDSVVTAIINDEENNEAVGFTITIPPAKHDIDNRKLIEYALPGLLGVMGVDEPKVSFTHRKTADGADVLYIDMAPDQDSLDHESFSDLLLGKVANRALYDAYFGVPEVE